MGLELEDFSNVPHNVFLMPVKGLSFLRWKKHASSLVDLVLSVLIVLESIMSLATKPDHEMLLQFDVHY